MLVNKPPMGWNTWNTFALDINDTLVRESADAFIDLGFKDAGYQYIVIDDGWSLDERDKVTKRIVPDPAKFPNGMKDLADYVHSKGLKFGMYSCAGQRTCGDRPGSFDHEFMDAKMFAEWGVDFLKYDYCFKPKGFEGELLYRRMGMALRETGRDIVFSVCNWGSDNVWDWIRSCGAHMYRSTGDIGDMSESFRLICESQRDKLHASAPQCYNDMDMLTVGMYGKGAVSHGPNCTAADYRSQFAMWCMCSVPLMLGSDIRKMDKETLDLVKNPTLIAIDQDPECRPPIFLGDIEQGSRRIIAFKHLDGDKYAVAFFNFSEKPWEMSFTFSDVGLTAASGLGFSFTPVLGNLKGEYAEYCRSTKIPPRDVVLSIAKTIRV